MILPLVSQDFSTSVQHSRRKAIEPSSINPVGPITASVKDTFDESLAPFPQQSSLHVSFHITALPLYESSSDTNKKASFSSARWRKTLFYWCYFFIPGYSLSKEEIMIFSQIGVYQRFQACSTAVIPSGRYLRKNSLVRDSFGCTSTSVEVPSSTIFPFSMKTT